MKALKIPRIQALAVLLLVPFLVACSATPPVPTPSAGPQDGVRIGLSLPNDSDPFYQAIKSGAESLVLRRGGRLFSSSAGSDAARQESEIQALLVNEIQVLLVVPVDSERIASAVQAANRAGIPVITLDRAASGGEVLAHVAADNTWGGRMAGSYLAQQLAGRGIVVELQGSPGVSITRQRADGFSQALQSYPDLHLVATEPANFSRERAQQVFAHILTQHAQIDAVFAHSDEMLIGAQAAAKEAGRDGEMLFVGFDGVPDVVAGIDRGVYAATIAQQPEEMGRRGVELALLYLQGESIPSTWLVELALLAR